VNLPVYEEPVFRPPSEASSLILQLTIGCSWNRCTFCAMYRAKQYRVRPVEDLEKEIASAATHLSGMRRVFLADGDALAAPYDVLERVLLAINRHLPEVQRVGVYGDSRSILKHGSERLAQLRDLGLGIVYFGPETGDPETLREIVKGATAERQLAACHGVLEAGLKLSLMVLLGVAGTQGSERHARETGRFLVRAAPTFASALTTTPVPGTEIHQRIVDGELELPDRWGMLQELEWMLSEMDGYRGPFYANHASNYLPLRLRLPKDHRPALEMIRRVLRDRDEAALRPEWMRGL
jgi:radical SAM superfamily enzyme YgiQ (UPF0313 family)